MADADCTPPAPIQCHGCGETFTPSKNDPRIKYCAKSCRDKNGREDRICVCAECGAEFRPTRNSGGKYCSNRCNGIAVMRVAAFDRREAALKRIVGKYSRVKYAKCACCEVETVGPRIRKAASARFCQSCKDILGRAIYTHGKRLSFLKDRLWGRRCPVCGGIFTPFNEVSTFCSTACYQRSDAGKAAAARHRASPAARRRKRIENRKRRALKYGNGPTESIDPLSVFNRDGWVCYICGTDTPKQLVGHASHPDAPTLDHVVALANGGTHTKDNVRCCCRSCNSRKGAAEAEEFLQLNQ